jgi:type II pantothenate kinase
MKIHLGIDVGATNTKLVALDEARQWVTGTLFPRDETPVADKLLALLPPLRYTYLSLALTGVGAYQLPPEISGCPVTTVREFDATGRGGLALSGLSEAVVVSMGTGTSFVHAREESFRHIIGSGIGGGTLLGLGSALTGATSPSDIEALAARGDLGHVDLTIGELTPGGHLGLAPDLTASNFGSVKRSASEPDLALGTMNLVFQAIGTMSVLATRLAGTPEIVLTGTLTRADSAPAAFARFAEAYGVRFTIPTRATFATAYGAALAINI